MSIAKRALQQSASRLELPTKSGYSKAQMGSIEYREILANLRSLRDFEEKAGLDFVRYKNRLANFGTLDYRMVQATIFRENWERSLQESGAMNLENFELLQKKLNRIKNPINFYEYIQKSNVFMDIFVYYKEGEGLNSYGDFGSTQERFNLGLEELGLL